MSSGGPPQHIHIISDLEGAAMVFHWSQTEGDTEAKRQAMRMLTGEVNACIDGILDFHADSVAVVWDGHGDGGLDYESIHARASVLPNASTPRPFGLDSSFDALFFVGQHSMAGTRNGCLAHTYAAEIIERVVLNGQEVGEFGMCAYMAGALFGVPAAFLSGDDKAVNEAQKLVPNLVGVAVKEGLGMESALSMSPARARAAIREGAALACERISARAIAPLELGHVFRWELTVASGHERRLDRYAAIPGAEIDKRSVIVEGHDPSVLHW